MFKDNWTALISASKEGHVHIVEELLKCGVNLEHRDMVCMSVMICCLIRWNLNVIDTSATLYFCV